MMMIRRLVMATATAMFLSGCAAGTSTATHSPSAPSPSPSPSRSVGPLDASCGESTAGGQTVRFGAGGATNLVGVVVGTGRTGVVLAHERRGSRCQWASYGQELAKAGYRALIFDFAGSGLSTGTDTNDAAVTAATGYLRAQGVGSVVLIGASMGGTAVLATAAQTTPPVAGVVSLSGPAFFQGLNAAEVVKKLQAPVLYAACAGDTGFVEDARALYDATPADAAKKLLVVPGCNSHGVRLVASFGGPETNAVRTAVNDFLAAHAPA